MIKVTRFNQTELIVNADLIEFVETTPDTVITMLTGRKVLVRETAEEIVRHIIAYRRAAGPLVPRAGSESDAPSEMLEAAGSESCRTPGGTPPARPG